MILKKISNKTNIPWGQRGTAGATIAGRVTFENVTRLFSDHYAVREFSLDISPGEIVCLLGPSGCGKTTLLRMAAGIERPSHGRILLNDQEVSGSEKFVLPEDRNVGLMFQDFALFPHLRIIENVAFGLSSLSRVEAQKIALTILRRVGLAHYADDFPYILSGGEQQRVALARAIAPRPSVLLMDEPFSGLDPKLRDNMREETLAILHETRATCIIVTHQPDEAMRMGDRIVIMNEGQLVQVGTAKQLYNQPENIFVARLFSEINELIFKVTNGQVQTPFGIYDAKGFANGTDVIIGIRKSDIRLCDVAKGEAGRVIRNKFLGETTLLEIAVNGLDIPIIAKVRQEDAKPAGEEIGINVDSKRVLVFRANDVNDKPLRE